MKNVLSFVITSMLFVFANSSELLKQCTLGSLICHIPDDVVAEINSKHCDQKRTCYVNRTHIQVYNEPANLSLMNKADSEIMETIAISRYFKSIKCSNYSEGTPLDNDCNCTIWIIIAVIVIVLASVIAITYAYPYCKKKMEKYKLSTPSEETPYPESHEETSNSTQHPSTQDTHLEDQPTTLQNKFPQTSIARGKAETHGHTGITVDANVRGLPEETNPQTDEP